MVSDLCVLVKTSTESETSQNDSQRYPTLKNDVASNAIINTLSAPNHFGATVTIRVEVPDIG